MDQLNEKIIMFLKKDSRMSFSAIAKEVGVSEGAIRQRVAKLVAKGIISRFTIDVKTATNAIVEISTSSTVPTGRIAEKVKKFASRAYEVTGKHSIVAFVDASTMDELNRKLESIRSIEGVVGTETLTVLKEC